jgi:predicted ATPase
MSFSSEIQNQRVMRFEINNIGKLRDAQIDLNGITVIAGHNSTGKSTFGKTLFCVFHHFFDEEGAVRRENKRNLESAILPFVRFATRTQPRAADGDKKLQMIVDEILGHICPSQETAQIMLDFIKTVISRHLSAELPNEMLDDLYRRVMPFASADIDNIRGAILARYLTNALGGRVTHVNYPDRKGQISLLIQGRKTNVTLHEDGSVALVDNVGIVCDAFYINTPFVLDDMSAVPRIASGRLPISRYSHKYHLLSLLSDSMDDNDVISEVDVKRRISSILTHIRSIVDGEFVEDENGLRFQESGLNEPLEFVSISTGVKAFLIIRRLLELGKIKDKYVLILDEPEVHLHPEWQLKFAELLVMLQKEFALTVLLTTHSPYVINAIETYSQKYEIADRCTYYLTQNQSDYATVQEVTKNTNSIYQMLAKPFRQLENERED